MRALSEWGQGIVVGVTVTSFGRHGVGQPAITGEVVAVERDQASVRLPNGTTRKRSTSNLKITGAPATQGDRP